MMASLIVGTQSHEKRAVGACTKGLGHWFCNTPCSLASSRDLCSPFTIWGISSSPLAPGLLHQGNRQSWANGWTRAQNSHPVTPVHVCTSSWINDISSCLVLINRCKYFQQNFLQSQNLRRDAICSQKIKLFRMLVGWWKYKNNNKKIRNNNEEDRVGKILTLPKTSAKRAVCSTCVSETRSWTDIRPLCML